mgnify:CR=1 FL=1
MKNLIRFFFVFSSILFGEFDYFQITNISSQRILSICQDSAGFVWVGTDEGLNRFDGYEFKRFKATGLKGSISGNWVTACLQDENNQLWFATASKGLNRLDTTTGQFNTYTSSSSLLPLSDDKIWFLCQTMRY